MSIIASEIVRESDRLKAVLRTMDKEMQAAALADVTAWWLAGHLVEGDAARTRDLRQGVWSAMTDMVQRILPVAHDAILEHIKTVRSRN